ncbi:hypothetical protein [Rhizobacter sp. SG703]|uniref:hypothetical protein n=1 Tax=Rhizobacter sp. SG703 TaxID=2587140 RepID=UPI0014458C70|nr:hypothetical protein [Rhizobacter sp. SG703]NKI96620.1 hypothetical protein [Rhizobacter sp. SG703]
MPENLASNLQPELLRRAQDALMVASRMGCAMKDLVGRVEDDLALADQYGIVCAMQACIDALENAVQNTLDEMGGLVKRAEVNHG